MHKTDRSFYIVSGITAVICAAVFIASRFIPDQVEEKSLKPHIISVLDLDSLSSTTSSLVVGYNYYLLDQYAENDDRTVDIRISGKNTSYLDSLRAGVIDILVIPYEEDLQLDGLIFSSPIDSLSTWVMREDESHEMDNLNRWIDNWHENEENDVVRESFMHRYNVFKSRRREHLSPYDSLIKEKADSMGWDWRMLAAVIYTESKFAINVSSPMGAKGLMQIMPLTVKVYDVQNPLDPEENIRAGANYLGRLDKLFRKIEPAQERVKYVLGAYTAGESRILQGMQRMEMAARDSLQNAEIDSVVAAQVDSVKAAEMDSTSVSGPAEQPKWITNANMYIDRVMKVYADFCRICPE